MLKQKFRESCDYFMIPFTSENVKCDNLAELMHELSNQVWGDFFGFSNSASVENFTH